MFALLALTLGCIGCEAVYSLWLDRAYPYDWPLMPPNASFRDFSLYQDRFALYHSPAFFKFAGEPFMYPAPTAAFYRFFFFLPQSLYCFLGVLGLSCIAVLLLFGRALLKRGVGVWSVVALLSVVLLCSYPFAFEFEQANVEWILWVFVSAGTWAFVSKRDYSAATCFGIAASMKIYPIVFVGLFISRKQYAKAALVIGTALLCTVFGLWLLCPNLHQSWLGTEAGIMDFRSKYMLGFQQVGFDHSLFAVPKAAGCHEQICNPVDVAALAHALNWYMRLVAIAGIAIYFGLLRKLPIINHFICLTTVMILFPPVSYDYTLIHLYAPWGLLALLALEQREAAPSGLVAALICFAVLFAPTTEFILRGHSVGGQLKAFALISLLSIGLCYPFPSRYDLRPA